MLLKRDITNYKLTKAQEGLGKGADMYASFAGIILPSHSPSSDVAVMSYGTTAIAHSTPNSPLFSAATFLGELRNDGLPSPSGVQLWRERAKAFRSLGSEYLNVEFGWRPFVADLLRFGKAVKKTAAHVNSFTSAENKLIRVGHNSGKRFSTESWDGRIFVTAVDNTSFYSAPTGNVTVTNGEEQWFKGAYAYYAPSRGPLSAVSGFERQANLLFGTRLTPEVVWNLAPWTWALDWFGNVGDVMHNLSTIGHDGLVLKYGYVMSHTKTETILTTPTIKPGTGDPHSPLGTSSRKIQETKKRFPASPYFGFGAPGELSASQVAILAALGMSRGPR
jgi:hypothetical protein